MKERNRERRYRTRRAVLRLASFLCGMCMLAGGLAVLCGFGMSDPMTAPGAFCMMLSASGAAAMTLGLRMQQCLKERECRSGYKSERRPAVQRRQNVQRQKAFSVIRSEESLRLRHRNAA